MGRLACLTLLALLLLPSIAPADMIIGGEVNYTTQEADCLLLVAAKAGVDWQVIARENGLEANKRCMVGVRLTFTNRRIVPKVLQDGIIINIPGRMLYFFKEGKLAGAFPVGLGSRDWPTPTGRFVIVRRETDPTWYVPTSIQREMEDKGKPVKQIVAPGEDNPLGRYALHTSLPGVLIHETIWPTTVYQWRSHGCIRVLPDEMERFYDEVEKGTPGEIIYQPVSIAISGEGRILLQVDRDIYRRVKSMAEEARTQIESRGLSGRVDWAKVERAIKQKTGLAEDVTL